MLPADPLLAGALFRFQSEQFPLGFCASVSSNSELVIAAAEQSWLGRVKIFDLPPVRIAIGVEGDEISRCAKPPVFRARGHLLSAISDPANFVVCDLRTGEAFGWVTPATAANTALFRYQFLEAAVLTMLEQLYLAPVHAALVARNGAGVLLCGDSGAGKSTLALACAVAGWDFISDDGSYLIRNRADLYAVGNSHVIRLRADAARFFTHLTDRIPMLRPNGKVGFEMFTRDAGIQIVDGAEVKHVVFLERSPTAVPQLAADSPYKRAEYFQRTLRYGDEAVQREQNEAFRRLTSVNCWTLTYRDFEDGVRMLDLLLRERRSWS